MAAYATAQNLIDRKSVNTIGDLISEDGTQVNEAGILAPHAKVTAALEAASGAIEAALLQGGRYTVANLATVFAGGGAVENSKSYLTHLCVEVAMAYLFALKPTYSTDEYKAALDVHDVYLERLRKGENVFNLADPIDAGTPDWTAPSIVSIQNLQLIRDMTRSYYPVRRSNQGSG